MVTRLGGVLITAAVGGGVLILVTGRGWAVGGEAGQVGLETSLMIGSLGLGSMLLAVRPGELGSRPFRWAMLGVAAGAASLAPLSLGAWSLADFLPVVALLGGGLVLLAGVFVAGLVLATRHGISRWIGLSILAGIVIELVSTPGPWEAGRIGGFALLGAGLAGIGLLALLAPEPHRRPHRRPA